MNQARKYLIELTGPQIKSLGAVLRQIDAQVSRPQVRKGFRKNWPESRRAMFRALKKRGLTMKAIAAELGLTVSAVYRQQQHERDAERIAANSALVKAVAPKPYTHPIYSAIVHLKDEAE